MKDGIRSAPFNFELPAGLPPSLCVSLEGRRGSASIAYAVRAFPVHQKKEVGEVPFVVRRAISRQAWLSPTNRVCFAEQQLKLRGKQVGVAVAIDNTVLGVNTTSSVGVVLTVDNRGDGSCSSLNVAIVHRCSFGRQPSVMCSWLIAEETACGSLIPPGERGELTCALEVQRTLLQRPSWSGRYLNSEYALIVWEDTSSCYRRDGTDGDVISVPLQCIDILSDVPAAGGMVSRGNPWFQQKRFGHSAAQQSCLAAASAQGFNEPVAFQCVDGE
jgi:hypothetical protein